MTEASLSALKAATVSAEWELAPGATELRSALDQIDAERPHVLVAFGDVRRTWSRSCGNGSRRCGS